MFMSDKRKNLLVGCMLEMLEHPDINSKTHALAVLENAIKRESTSTKELVMSMARILEIAEKHSERVMAHDMAGCD